MSSDESCLRDGSGGMTQTQTPGDAGMRQPAEFETAYATTAPRWDIGRPQGAFVALAESGAIRGRVLDVGCGTGEHVLMVAASGLDATGIDTSESAISVAEEKARDRRLAATFLVHDALRLASLDEQFDTVLDCGLFHVLEDASRAEFAHSLRSVLRAGGHYFVLCFSDRQPVHIGPRRVSQEEIREIFAEGWRINSIEPSRIENKTGGGLAWLADITRL